MKKLILAVTALALSTTANTTVSAQSAQERIDDRYDRALAAGYKALFLCSAIANAETNGTTRSAPHIIEWELTGIQAPLTDMIPELDFALVRSGDGALHSVRVSWSEDNDPRIAIRNRQYGGCSIQPLSGNLRVELPAPEGVERVQSFAATDINYEQLRHGRPVRVDVVPTGFPNAFSETYGAKARTTAALVIKDGKTISETYAEGFGPETPQRTWSVAKSIAATFVGAVIHAEGFGTEVTDQSAGVKTGEDPRAAITIDHALRMASGRYSDTAGNRTDPLYWGGTTVTERAQNWPLLDSPGTVFRYANNDTLAAVQAIQLGFDNRYRPGPFLLRRIGMEHTVAEVDWQGNYVLSSQVWATARDLAKLGQLHLDDGRISRGRRILPEGWVEYVSDPSGPQPVGTDWGYGAGWWTFRRPEGNAFEGIPDDAFAARGNRGQYVVVVPSRKVVIVRRGEDMVGTRFDIASFTRDVLAALEE